MRSFAPPLRWNARAFPGTFLIAGPATTRPPRQRELLLSVRGKRIVQHHSQDHSREPSEDEAPHQARDGPVAAVLRVRMAGTDLFGVPASSHPSILRPTIGPLLETSLRRRVTRSSYQGSGEPSSGRPVDPCRIRRGEEPSETLAEVVVGDRFDATSSMDSPRLDSHRMAVVRAVCSTVCRRMWVNRSGILRFRLRDRCRSILNLPWTAGRPDRSRRDKTGRGPHPGPRPEPTRAPTQSTWAGMIENGDGRCPSAWAPR